jgi:uncharacterized protein YlxW (UPF0749 family)
MSDPSSHEPVVEGSGPPAGTEPRRAGMEALQHSFLRPSRGQVVVAVLVALLAFAAVTQVRTNGQDDTYRGLRQADLIQTLNGLQAATRKAESDITRLENTRAKLRDDSQKRATALQQAQTQLRTLGVLAGTLPARGPGIRITVTDPDGTLTLTHLLDGIEELRNAGVEAMEINDKVRVVAQTSFEDNGDGILVDGIALRSPYVIDAIGSPTTLAGALSFDGGFTDDVTGDGGKVSVARPKRVDVSVTRTPPTPRYATPVPGQ